MSTTSSYPASSSAAASSSNAVGDDDSSKNNANNGKKKTTKRRKVNHACLYCRRSHMTCDEGRPCQRCIKREIGHLCHDERRPKPSEKAPATGAAAVASTSATPAVVAQPVQTVVGTAGAYAPITVYPTPTASLEAFGWPANAAVGVGTGGFGSVYQPETFGNEFRVLTDFLDTLDDSSFFTPPTTVVPALMSSASFSALTSAPPPRILVPPPAAQAPQPPAVPIQPTISTSTSSASASSSATSPVDNTNATSANLSVPQSALASPLKPPSSPDPTPSLLPLPTKTEKFLLTAADQASGSRLERLNRVIRSKYEAGLLKPYNYVHGYARLGRWMDRTVSLESKAQILQPLSVLRPKFRAIAKGLTDLDLVFIEEAFERMLLDYDRVFSAMGVPACLWRRTGEIYKGNREFCELVGVDGGAMRDGRLTIYELMAEESAVNYWEKYGHVAFDSTQKAVLTSCVLRYKPNVPPLASTTSPISSPALLGIKEEEDIQGEGGKGKGRSAEETGPTEEGFINCCFSFTIRRDKWGIPTMIVGNFMAC